MRALLTISLALVAAGCATPPLTAQQCGAIDWRAEGRAAGAAGAASPAPALPQECAGFGFAPDLAAFEAGYAEGLTTFCAPENGYALGAEGRAYEGQCAGRGDQAFLLAYGDGKTMFGFTSAVDAARARAADAERSFESAERALAEHEDRLARLATASPEEQSKGPKIERRARELRRDMPRLRQNIARAYREVEAAERALASYEARLDRKFYAAPAGSPVNVTVNVNTKSGAASETTD